MEFSVVVLVLVTLAFFLAGLVLGRRSMSIRLKKSVVNEEEAQTRAKEFEHKYRLLRENSYDGLAIHEIVYDPDGNPVDAKYIEVNDQFLKLFQLTRDIIGKGMLEVVPYANMHWIREFDQVIRSGETMRRTGYNHLMDFYYELTLFPIGNNILGGAFHDINNWVKSEQYFRNIITNINGIFFAINNQGIFTVSEGLGLATISRKPESLKGKSAFDVFSEHADLTGALRTCLDGNLVETIIRMNESYFDARFTPIFDSEKNVISVLGIAADVTEQTKANQLLRQSEAKYRNIIESIHSGFSLNELVFDSFGNPSDITILYANDMFGKLCRIAIQDISHKRYSELFPGEWKELTTKAYAVVATGKSYTRVMRMGSDRFVESVMYKAENNQFIRFDNDLTDLLSAENKLQSSREKFLSIYTLLPDMAGIMRLPDMQFIECNPAFTEITGFTPEQYTGKTPFEMGLTEEPSNINELLDQINKNEPLRNFEPVIRTRDGQSISLLISAKRITYESSDCILFIAHRTAGRRGNEPETAPGSGSAPTEEQRNAMSLELEKKIAERTAQLKQAMEDQEAFAYSISHDLRSPLRHIEGFLRLLINKMDTQDETVKGYFEKIYMASNRMSAMIDDLLLFSRLGRKELDVKPVDLNILINELIEQFKITYQNREIEWKISLLPTIPCDANLFKTVFENLISNAIKYTSKKPLAVIEIGARDLPDNLAEVFVRDNGVGFNSIYANRLFRVFQRLHASDDFSGTGIGLANVKQIITRHNGKVRAEGIVNEGATFYLTLHK